MKNNRIDIIIPAFKAHNTIVKTLASIIQQSVIDDIDITIVNDGCPEGDYQDIIKAFENYASIRELKLPKNLGPAKARQYGLDQTFNEFIVFVDSDDALLGSYAIETMKARIQTSETFQCCSTYFQEVLPNMERIIQHEKDMIWLFGKIYRREFIESHNIRFINSRASNQDAGFNMLVKLYCNNDKNQICYTDDCTYTWFFNPGSITTIGNFQFEYDQSICGYVDNMIYVSDHIAIHDPLYDISQWEVYILTVLYCKFNMVIDQFPIFSDQTWYYVKKFYHNSYLKYYRGIDETGYKSIVYQTINEQNQNPCMENVIPVITFFQFMDKLYNEEFKEDEILEIRKKLPPEYRENNILCGMEEGE